MDDYYLYTTTTPSTASGSSSFPPKNNNARDKKKKKVPAGNNNNNNNNKMIKTSNNNNGVKLSTDPQSVAARERRHRISDRFKILQSVVPGGTKMDTVSMLEETINYVKFLKTQIFLHQSLIMDLDHHDPYNLLNCNYQIPTVPSHAHLQQVQPSCCSNLEHSSFVVTGSVQPPSTTSYLPLIDSCFQGEDSVRYDHAYVNNNSRFS